MAGLRVPWFAAAAARRREPSLEGRPLVLGAPRQGVWRVAAVSAEAAAAGVRVGMPLAQAEALCPELVRRPLDAAYLAREAERLVAALEAHVAVEVVEPGGALFAPVGLCRVTGPEAEQRALGRLIDAIAVVTGYLAAVGVAEGRGAAWIAARRAATGVVEQVPPGGVAAYLGPLPAALLPVSAEMQRRLELLGLRTIGALAALPLGAVQAQFGPEGRLAWEIAHGRDARPLAPRTPPCVPSAEVALDAPCTERGLLLAEVGRLLERALAEVPPGQVVGCVRVVATMEAAGAISGSIERFGTTGGRGQAPALRVGGDTTWEQRVVLREPTAEVGAMRFAVTAGLLRAPPLGAVVGLRVELRDVGAPTPLQLGLFDARGAGRLALAAAVRGLRARFAANPLARVVGLDPRHRLPERRYVLMEAS